MLERRKIAESVAILAKYGRKQAEMRRNKKVKFFYFSPLRGGLGFGIMLASSRAKAYGFRRSKALRLLSEVRGWLNTSAHFWLHRVQTMKNETKKAAEAASGARVRLGEIKAEQIAFLPDSVTIRGAVYYRVVWTYAGEGDNLARVGWGWARLSAVPCWATPSCGSARRGAFVLGDVYRRGPMSRKNGWDLLIDSISEEGRAE